PCLGRDGFAHHWRVWVGATQSGKRNGIVAWFGFEALMIKLGNSLACADFLWSALTGQRFGSVATPLAMDMTKNIGMVRLRLSRRTVRKGYAFPSAATEILGEAMPRERIRGAASGVEESS